MEDAPVNGSAGERLRRWRTAQEPKLTLSAAAARIGVKHPTWIDWENSNRRPALEKAIAIEVMTGGEVPIEAWGFDRTVMEGARQALDARDDHAATGTGG